jgi:glucan phosphoethanolaminetransferase (alkaline phosphatase superfamily)
MNKVYVKKRLFNLNTIIISPLQSLAEFYLTFYNVNLNVNYLQAVSEYNIPKEKKIQSRHWN